MRIAVLTMAATAVVSLGASQNPPQRTQQPVFRATTDQVRLDVRVRDEKGVFIPNLRRDQFEIYEDDVRQEINYFDMIVGGQSLIGTTVMQAPKRTPGLIVPSKRQSAPSSGRVFILFIDDLHFEPSLTMNVRQLLKQVRDELIKENDLLAIVSSGFSSIEMGLGYDYGRRRINEAIEKTMGSAMTIREILDAAQTSEGPAGLRYMTHTAFKTVYGLLEGVSQINDRRKAFIYVSGGYDFNPYKDSRLKTEQDRYGIIPQDSAQLGSDAPPPSAPSYINPLMRTGSQFAEADLVSDMAALIRAANRVNATFYALDPRGLMAMPPINTPISMTEYQEHISTSVSSLRAISEETGGFCACGTNDYSKALERIDNETSDYYMLGYRSSNPDPLKVRRLLTIKVNVKGATVLHRQEYTLERR
jgi:VWFA-related protein